MITNENGRNVFTAYCPGNYSNIYREFNGDASIMLEVYIDIQTRRIIYGSVIPMWTYAYSNGNYRPVPLNEIESLKLTTDDVKRADEINRVITSTVFGHEFKFDMIRDRYYFDSEGFIRETVSELQNVHKNRFLERVNSCKSVCFIGDSITQGTKNGGVSWYEPLMRYITAEIHNFSWGGGTVKTLRNM